MYTSGKGDLYAVILGKVADYDVISDSWLPQLIKMSRPRYLKQG